VDTLHFYISTTSKENGVVELHSNICLNNSICHGNTQLKLSFETREKESQLFLKKPTCNEKNNSNKWDSVL
jgi:hypothetical protein